MIHFLLWNYHKSPLHNAPQHISLHITRGGGRPERGPSRECWDRRVGQPPIMLEIETLWKERKGGRRAKRRTECPILGKMHDFSLSQSIDKKVCRSILTGSECFRPEIMKIVFSSIISLANNEVLHSSLGNSCKSVLMVLAVHMLHNSSSYHLFSFYPLCSHSFEKGKTQVMLRV